MAQTVTFTTYKHDGVSISGTPFVLGFKDKIDDNFDNTGDSAEADLELPPPPPSGGTTGAPVSTSYIDTMYIHLDNDIKGYQYFLSNDTTDELALDLAVRDYEDDNVTFKYNQDSVTNMFGKLEITNSIWTIDLVTSTVTGASNGLPSISTADSVTTVVLPHLGDEVYYTMNVQKFVEGPSEMTINVVEGWNMIGLSTNGQLVDDADIVVAGSIFWYGGSSYELFQPDALTADRGYWVRCNASGTIKITLDSNLPETPNTISVVEGWNMIGLSTNGQLVDDADIVVAGSIFWYGGSSYELFQPESLTGNRGYWVRCSAAGTIQLNFTE